MIKRKEISKNSLNKFSISAIKKSFSFKDTQAVLVTTPRNKILYCAKSAAKIIGKDPAQLLNAKIVIPKNQLINITSKSKKKIVYKIELFNIKCDNKNYKIIFFIKCGEAQNKKKKIDDCKIKEKLNNQISEEALKESEERFKLVLEANHLGFWDWNLETGEMSRSHSWSEMLGYSSEEVGKDIQEWYNFIHPDEQAAVWKVVQDHLEGKTQFYKVEYRLRCKDGKYKWILDVGKIVKYNDFGKPIRMCGAQADINERKQTEIDLSISQERYKMFVQQSSDGIYRLDFDNPIDIKLPVDEQIDLINNTAFIAEYNAKLREMYAAPKGKEIIGMRLNEFQIIDDKIKNRNERRKFIESGYRTIGSVTKEKTFDGKIKYFSNSVVGIIKNGMLIQAWGTQFDITEHIRIKEELIKAKEKAESSSKLKSEFLAQMSHEIRTPMNVTLSYADLIKYAMKEKLTPEVNEYFEAIKLAGLRLIRTVDLLLNTSEMQIGSYEPIWKDIDLSKDIMEQIFVEMKGYALKKDIRFNYVNNVPDCYIKGDLYSVNQIFTNLVENAIKYTEKGEIDILIEKNNENGIIVEVKDSGIGISEDFRNNIFEPFMQEERGYSRKFEGSGLGLALVKKYCDLNKAKITCNSEKGKGTKFSVNFPKIQRIKLPDK